MKHLFRGGILVVCLIFTSLTAQAQDTGISAADTYELVKNRTEPVLFVDVRDPIEIMFIGFTDAVNINIPYLIVDRNQWDAENQRFRLYPNPDFIALISAALAERGLDKNTMIVTMCRSGSERGEPSARFLIENGFPNARFVIDGFQGSAAKDGPHKGLRIINGWQNSGLPWQSKPDPEKIFRMDREAAR